MVVINIYVSAYFLQTIVMSKKENASAHYENFRKFILFGSSKRKELL